MGCCGKKTGANDGEDVEMKETSKWGKPNSFDPSFNGPIKNRSCTDIPCCILFVLYVLGMVALGIAAYTMGNPYKLLNSVDSYGNICGYDTGFVDKPKLVFFDLTECINPTALSTQLFSYSCPTKQICRPSCPDINALGYNVNASQMVCDYDVNPTGLTILEKMELIKQKKCAPYYLKSTDVLNRCVPTIVNNQLGNLLETNQATGQNITAKQVEDGSLMVQAMLNLQNLGQKVIQDVQESWYAILGGLGIAMVASFIYILVMRWIAGLLVWITTYAVLTLLGFGIYYCWTTYTKLRDGATYDSSISMIGGLDSYTNSKETWYYLTIILGVILGILVLILLALRKRIQIAIALIKESSRAITNIVFTLFFPFIPWILQLILFGWFVSVLVFLVTSGATVYKNVDGNGTTGSTCSTPGIVTQTGVSSNITCQYINFADNDHVFRMQVYHLFGWFWIMNFIIALGQCVLAGAFASYYWAFDKKNDIPTFPVAASFYRTLRYHTGSLAFGSLIIAIVQLIRAALEYLDHKLRGQPGQQSEIAKYLMKCLKCCFWCLEKFLKFLNKNAYIEIAVYGKNFCVSAKNAFFLLMRNILRVVVIDKVTDFLLFIGQLSITLGVGVGAFYWFERQKNLNYYLAPVFIIVIGSYVIASAFFNVYNMAIDTVFLCFLEDLERNDGSDTKPYYMSKRLKKIMGKKNKKNSDEEED
ncbi:choline transporter-like protein 4 [Nematostella vectensis]|uniref:choline transporter-like protein 4 n=1 Tax=Nematostella vectensis TaxID=45351 RepID=UPI002076EC2C|nr:choline transporter-like protein 4 [Nematostella vectensis]